MTGHDSVTSQSGKTVDLPGARPMPSGIADTAPSARDSSVMPRKIASDELIFGMIALQQNMVTRDQVVSAFEAWGRDTSQKLSDILVQQGALDPARREALEPIVELFVSQRGARDEVDTEPLSDLRQGRQIELGDLDTSDMMCGSGPGRPAQTDSRRASREVDDTEAADGKSLGRFRVLRPYARGGLGLVSVALDRDLNREVALKQLLPQRADDQDCRQRFMLEAQITGGLEHPGIVPVYALGEGPDGRPYYAMRFVQGTTLQEAIDDFHRLDHPNRQLAGARQLALSQLLGRFIDVCNAMEYAHSRDVLHRDIKPRNIMLGKYGETLLVDWGLAKSLGTRELPAGKFPAEGLPEDALSTVESIPRRVEQEAASALSVTSGQTQYGSVIGTPSYMSPEQAAGRLDEFTPATDVYCLGATLYHLLTGQPPFGKKANAATVHKVRLGTFPNPRDVNAEVPSALQAICLKAMSLNPTDRYQTARELADDVERWLANEPLVAGMFHQLRQRLAVQYEREFRPAAAYGGGAAEDSGAGLSLLSLIQTRRVRYATDGQVGPVDYELANLRGESVLAQIFQARQVALDREVVVKVFKPRELDGDDQSGRTPEELAALKATREMRDRDCFLSEAVVTAHLEHPGIIPVHDIFKDDAGKLYMAMKWVRGTTWNKVLRDRTEPDNVAILLKAADVVAYAHDRGILHRNLKPDNVFLGTLGEICVVDWGAALVTPDFRSWGTLSVFPMAGWGSPLYAAPEQILGTVEQIGVRSDVYLLGAMLFEIVSGYPPHPVPANPADGLGILQRNEIRPTDYQGELLEIALKAMSTQPGDRYANVREFQAALRDFQFRQSSR